MSERIYKRAKEEIHRNAERIEKGLVNYIPFDMPRFEEAVPGIQRKNYTILTANSGIGKSRIAKCLYVIRPVDFVLRNPQLGIKLKTFYFCLEESKESFIQSIYCYKLYEKHGIRVPIKELKSIKNRKALPLDIRQKVDALDEYMERFEDMVEVVDDVKHAYGIYVHVKKHMEANGRWTKKTVPVWSDAAKETRMMEVNDYYVPTSEDSYVEVITDHVSKLHPAKGKDLWETIGEFSSIYCCDMRDKYLCSVLNVQQQAPDQEKKQFTHAGQSIVSKLEPSLDGLGDNKTTQRDADEVVGIFSPARHEIAEHRKYKIGRLDDNYRSLIQLKARDGEPNTRIGIYFDGGIYHCEELPPAEQMTDERYEYFMRKSGRSAPVSQRAFNFSTP